jgi:hypothetical protein
MKFLVVSGLLLFLLFLIYLRLRPYLTIARRVFQTARAMRDIGNTQQSNRVRGARRATGEPLARCVACGTWFPSSRALRAGSADNAFCSAACIERPQVEHAQHPAA